MENKENKTNKTIHLRLTDNETGQTLIDSDGDFALGVLCVDHSEARGFMGGYSSAAELLHAVVTLETMQERIYKDHPEVKKLNALRKALDIDHTVIEADLSALLNREQ